MHGIVPLLAAIINLSLKTGIRPTAYSSKGSACIKKPSPDKTVLYLYFGRICFSSYIKIRRSVSNSLGFDVLCYSGNAGATHAEQLEQLGLDT